MFDVTMGRPPEADAANEALRQRVWFQAISHLPVTIFRAACDRAVRECTFYPKPAEVLGFARDPLTDLRRRAFPDAGRYRGDGEPPEPTPEEQARVSALVRGFVERNKDHTDPWGADQQAKPASLGGASDLILNTCAARRARREETCTASCQRLTCELRT